MWFATPFSMHITPLSVTRAVGLMTFVSLSFLSLSHPFFDGLSLDITAKFFNLVIPFKTPSTL
jgi:hypothetical protein